MSSRPQARWMAELLAEVEKRGAECLHLKPGSAARVRVGAELRTLAGPPLLAAQTEGLAAALLTDAQRARLQADQALEVSVVLGEGGRLRLRFVRQRGSLEALVRPVRDGVPTLAALGLPVGLKGVEQLRGGLIVVAAAAGGGKTTTVAAIVHQIGRHRPCHVLCIDDPTELVHRPQQALVSQVEVGRDTPSAVAALKAALRQDVDVVVVEEPAEAEAVELLLHLCETGHLVVTSIAARSAAAAADWLVERAPPGGRSVFRERLARQLEVLLVQALLPRLDRSGRVLVSDLYVRSRALAQYVRDPASAPRGGLSPDASMDGQLIGLARQGLVSWEDALHHAVDKGSVERAIMFD
jgi:twitching motility protein PilT